MVHHGQTRSPSRGGCIGAILGTICGLTICSWMWNIHSNAVLKREEKFVGKVYQTAKDGGQLGLYLRPEDADQMHKLDLERGRIDKFKISRSYSELFLINHFVEVQVWRRGIRETDFIIFAGNSGWSEVSAHPD